MDSLLFSLSSLSLFWKEEEEDEDTRTHDRQKHLLRLLKKSTHQRERDEKTLLENIMSSFSSGGRTPTTSLGGDNNNNALLFSPGPPPPPVSSSSNHASIAGMMMPNSHSNHHHQQREMMMHHQPMASPSSMAKGGEHHHHHQQQQHPKEQLGRAVFQSTATEKVNSELFSLTYGAFVVQLLRDAEGDASFVNEKLRRAGKSIGNRLIEEYLAKMMNSGGMGNTNTNRNSVADSCKTFREVMENVAFVGFRMFLNARCRLVDWSSSSNSSSTNSNSTGTATLSNSQNSNTATNTTTTTNNNNNNMSENNSVTLAIDDLSLADFVELPEKYANSLSYCEIVCGVVEGALESVNARVKVQFCKDGLRNDLSSSYVGQTHESDRIVKNCKFALRVTSLGPIEDEPYPFKDDD